VLDNGVRVVTERIPTLKSVTVGIWVNTGSRDEQLSQAGYSHFLEHMFFKGTRSRSATEISREIDGLGGEMIPLLARVLQIADIFDALTSHRCYKPAYSPKAAVRIIEDETARGWRDPQVVNLFLRIHHDLITRIIEYEHPSDYSLSALRRNLVSLSPIMSAQAALLGYHTPVIAG